MTLSAFLKQFTPAIGDQAKTNLATDLFNEYIRANGMTFRDETEEKRCRRFFVLGFLIYQAMHKGEVMNKPPTHNQMMKDVK